MFVPAHTAVAAFAGAPRVARKPFRKDVDALIDQDSTPRGWPASSSLACPRCWKIVSV
jgi:hypothetical protein